jgi:two-component system, NarL family, sensor histidine kinase EvgS
MCVDNDWEPFEWVEKGVHKGIAGDLIRLISANVGVKVRLIDTAGWKETLQYSREGKCDILSFLNKTPEREKWLTFTEPIFKDPNVLVGRNEMKYITDLDNYRGSVVLPEGTSIQERFEKQYPHLKIMEVKNEKEAFKAVEEKRADLTLRSMVMTAVTIKNEGLFNLKIVGEPEGFENQLRIGVLKEKPEIRDILNKGIEKITKEDTENIINKYVTIVIKKDEDLTTIIYVLTGVLLILALGSIWTYTLRKQVAIEVAKNEENQKLLFEKNRQAELVGLIANISHQWRDGLSSISSLNLSVLTKLDFGKKVEESELKEFLMKIDNSIGFMSNTMESFLNFYKTSKEEEDFDLKESFDETVAIIDTKIKHGKLTINYQEEESVRLTGVKNQWMHVWLNIINNTINASVKHEIERPTLNVVVKEDLITFSDDCGGVEDKILEKIQNGTSHGLGIKMSREITQKFGWKMELKNSDKGLLHKISKVS